MYLHVSNTQIFMTYHFGLNLSDNKKTLIVNRVFHFNDFFLPGLPFKEMTGAKDSTATCFFSVLNTRFASLCDKNQI